MNSLNNPIVLISPYSDIAAIGLRQIAAVLKFNNLPVRLIFLPHQPRENIIFQKGKNVYSERVLERLGELCRNALFVGITVMTNYEEEAKLITQAVKKFNPSLLIWGGVHPTLRPLRCLQWADAVVLGEGEFTTLELANALLESKDIFRIKNLWIKRNGGIEKNEVRPLVQDLNLLPYPDYNLDDDWILDDSDEFKPMNAEWLKWGLAKGSVSKISGKITYQTMATRGCPHNCAYCCNNALRLLYRGQKYVRFRNLDMVIEEILLIKQKYPFVSYIGFSDDSFFAYSDDEIEEFAKKYKEKIGLPFLCLGSPLTITQRKIAALVEAGMDTIQMGIQTASLATKILYKRNIPDELVLEKIKLIHRYAYQVKPVYDLIINNPLEKDEDRIHTLQFLRKIPYPYRLQLFSLVPFPGTELTEKFKEQGLISSDESECYEAEYHLRHPDYITLLFALYRRNLPKKLLNILSFKGMIKLFNRGFFNFFIKAFYMIYKTIRTLV